MVARSVVYIYPDVAFAVSLLMNCLILWGTARINKAAAGWLRILGGAALGAAYSFAAAFPSLQFLHGFWLKVTLSVLMCAVVFAPINVKRFTVTVVLFYIVSFCLGGTFFGILYFFRSSPYSPYLTDVSRLVAKYFLPGLIITGTLYILVTRFAGRLLQKRLAQNIFHVPLKVLFAEAQVEVEALIDTGNQLQDPLSRIPVVVVEYAALRDIFPAEIRKAFEGGFDPDIALILESLSDTRWSTRFRVIPFTSLGRTNGMLIGFRPDRIEVISGDSLVRTRNVIVGVYHQELSPEGAYRALLHPDVLGGMTA